jgi:tRNA 2-selenouridine synthase
MPELIPQSAFADIFINDTPLLDVRAPLEFQHGSFPNVVNIPLLDDEQRAAVGSAYKQQGKQAAIALGNKLVSGAEKASRLSAWQDFLGNNPDSLLYCYRGGLRSQIVQDWLQQLAIPICRIEGGYKAMRRYLINVIEEQSLSSKFLIVAGKTGSGKTHLINKISASVDLEGIANHRGSAFGRRIDSQPGQIDFENNLAIAFLRLLKQQPRQIFLEDESRSIGSLSLPLPLHGKMLTSPIAMVEEPLETRVQTIRNDYIISNYQDFAEYDPAAAPQLFTEFLLSGLERIKKRLGEQKYRKIHGLMQLALEEQFASDDASSHSQWIRLLLTDYYDPMYDYQMNKKLQRVVYRGDSQEFLSWASHINSSNA